MKIRPFLLLFFICLGLFNGLLSSNPDSIEVQGPEDNASKNAKVRRESDQRPQVSENLEEAGGYYISLMRPVSDGTRVVWKEVARERFERIRDLNIPSDWRAFATNQHQRRPTESPYGNGGGGYFVPYNPYRPPWQSQNRFRGSSNNGQGYWNRQSPAASENGGVNTEVTIGANGYQVPKNNADENNNNNNNSFDLSTVAPEEGGDENQEDRKIQRRPTESPYGNGGGGYFAPNNPYRPRSPQNRFGLRSSYNGGQGYPRAVTKFPAASENGGVNTEVTIGANGYQVPKNNADENNNNNNNGEKNRNTFGVSSVTSESEDSNGKGTFGGNDPQISPNNAKGNKNNGAPKPVHLSTVAPEEGGDEGDTRRNPSTKAFKRFPPDSNFFAGMVNDFAFKMVDTMKVESNLVISPLSIYVALAMCYLGSDGRTKAQLERAMGMDENNIHLGNFHKGIKDLIFSVKAETPGYQLFLANGMLLGKNFTVDEQFNNDITRYYDAEIMYLDFENAELSLQYINRWVSHNTRDMITSILNSAPPPETRLLLLNAIFFKGIWELQFPIHLTKKGQFRTLNGTVNEVEFMNLYGETFPHYRSERYRHTFLKLPYENNEVSMIIALPFNARDAVLPRLRDRDLCAVRDGMSDTRLGKVSIPKFRLEDWNPLKKPLEDLGVTDIFKRNDVNLRKMRNENDVYASAIIHKAVIEVSEVGTVAAATTDVIYEPLIRSTKFEANHPFAFYVMHEPTGLVLFYGKVFSLEKESEEISA